MIVFAQISQLGENGLGEYAALANLTAVGAFVIVFVICTVWIVTKGLPRLLVLIDSVMQRHEKELTTARAEFLNSMESQSAVRIEAARTGHEAAQALAVAIHDLTAEIRRTHEDFRNDFLITARDDTRQRSFRPASQGGR